MSIKYGFSAGQVINRFSEDNYSGLLAQDTEQTLTIPDIVSDCGGSPQPMNIVAVITCVGATGMWVSRNSTAVIPTTTISDSNSELVGSNIPFMKIVKAGDVLHFISSTDNTQFCVSLYVSI